MTQNKYNLDVSKISKEEWELSNCKEYASYILSKYSKTEKQLRDKLKQCKKNYSKENIDKTIEFLKAHDFLDDENFARRFIEIHKNAYSKKVIRQKLYEKGIKKELLDKIFSSDEVNFSEDTLVKKLLLKKCPDYFEKAKDMDPKAKQKLYAFLMRKGFSYGTVKDIMKIEQ